MIFYLICSLFFFYYYYFILESVASTMCCFINVNTVNRFLIFIEFFFLFFSGKKITVDVFLFFFSTSFLQSLKCVHVKPVVILSLNAVF